MKVFHSKRGRLLAIAGAVLFLACAHIAYMRFCGNIFAGTSFSGTWLDRDGNLLRIFLTPDEKFRTKKNLASFPPEFIEAVILQEDRYFYGHAGINPAALFKAGWETYISKDRRMGASTITMQLARLKYRLQTKTIPGKIEQIFCALYLELCFTKKNIIEAYLNLAPCGGNIEGFPAAAWYYFNLPVEKLNLSQILMLAVIPQNPESRAPTETEIPEELLAARKKLFASWMEKHPEDNDKATELNLGVSVLCRFPFGAPHVTEYLETRRESNTGEHRTTIDHRLQRLCEDSITRYIEQNKSFGVSNAAALLVDYTSMEVRASVGSADYLSDEIQGQVNGTTSKRSPGSTLKPFIYALAIQQGLIHPETMLKDTPVSFNEYTPDNFGSDFAGPVHAWQALVDSRNIPAIALDRDIKNPDLYDFLKEAGITGLKPRAHYGLSIVLGSAEVTMMELARLYGIIANGGIMKNLVLEKTSIHGSSSGKRLLSPEAAFITRKMLEKNVPPSPVRPQTSRGVPIAFKTGTSIGFKDCWSIAIFDRYILCIWIGNFNGQGNNSFQGRTMATPLLFSIVDAILSDIPESARMAPPAVPETVSLIPVCSVSGCLPGPDCPGTVLTWFVPGVSPITRCRIHRKISIDTRTGYRTDKPEGKLVISEVREFWPSDLLGLFAEAGLPRLIPPPYPPEETRYDNRQEGFPPVITSPLSNTNYIIRPEDDRRKTLVLIAAADAEARELFWFADSSFIGRSKPGGKLLWKPETGAHVLTVVDQNGRSGTIKFTVSSGE